MTLAEPTPSQGPVLRTLRERAGLSQAEVAGRIGIPASVLSAYERGRREPRVDIFFRAVEATGFAVEFAPQPARLDLRVPDAAAKAAVLERVCALGMALPRRDRAPSPILRHAHGASALHDPLIVLRRAIACHQTLTRAGISNAIGGALSLAYHVTEPRATQDIDLNITLPKESARFALTALPSEVPWGSQHLEAIARDGQVRILWPVAVGPPMPLDLFFAEHEFHQVAATRTITVPMLDAQVAILSATDLVVFKTLLDGRQGWADIEEVLRWSPPSFDLAEALRWTIEILGPRDARVRQLRSLAAEFN